MFRDIYAIESKSYYTIEKKKKKKKFSLHNLLAFCFFYVRSINATDHLHENMQYSRDDDNNIDVKKKLSVFFSFLLLFTPPHTHTHKRIYTSLNRSQFFRQ